MIQQVTVFVPASIANLGCGFDIMGMAIESAIVEFFGAEHVEVVRHGIREGYLMNFVMGKTVE